MPHGKLRLSWRFSIDFGLSCLELAASSELLLARRGIFWADLCPILDYLLEYTDATAPHDQVTVKYSGIPSCSLFCSFRRGGSAIRSTRCPNMMSGRLSPSAAAPRQDPLGAPRLINAINPFALPRTTSEYSSHLLPLASLPELP
jgi:hypothetical protein